MCSSKALSPPVHPKTQDPVYLKATVCINSTPPDGGVQQPAIMHDSIHADYDLGHFGHMHGGSWGTSHYNENGGSDGMDMDCEPIRCVSTSCSDAHLALDRVANKSPTGNEEYDSLLEGIFQQMEVLRSYGVEQACQQGDGLIEHSKLDLKAPVKMVTGSGFIRASPEAVLEMLCNVEQRPTWDDLCDFGNVVRRLGDCSDVIYLSYQGKLGVCARDLCLLRAWRREADGTCVLVSSSVDCDDVPRVAGKVRAELRDCGYICSPAPGGCTLSYVIKLDMKGYIPLFFTNLIQSQHTFVIAMLRRRLEEEHALDEAGSIDGCG